MDLSQHQHHPALEEIVDVICNKTENPDRGFFRTLVAYYFAKMASSMRAHITTQDRGDTPVNLYALLLATSGYGKGHSVSIMEDRFIDGFRRRFMDVTFPKLADAHLWDLANDRAARFGKDPQEEYDRLHKEFVSAGQALFTFDSGTIPAIKQLRQKLLLSNCGSINLQIDEIGMNLVSSIEPLTGFLELFDQGKIKQKLVKNTQDNQRGEDLDGRTPANLLMFGTPTKIFDGSSTEDHFYSLLDTGYARRCFFAMGVPSSNVEELPAEELWRRAISQENNDIFDKWNKHFYSLADPMFFNWKIQQPEDTSIALIRYRQLCERRARAMPESDEIQRAEMSHRYSRAQKLAGAYAFIDKSDYLTLDNLNQAILLVEESGQAFQQILRREKNYVKVAKHLADVGIELTHADLHEKFPSFYSTASGRRNETMGMAAAWGYKNHIIIKKTFVDGIEFFKADALKPTDLSQLILSHSRQWADGYVPDVAPFEKLPILTQAEGMQWCNHRFRNGHRSKEDAIPGFNMVVLDVDGTATLPLVHDLLKEYVFMTYTTKRHLLNPDEHRFRVIIPINYELNLTEPEYKEFMQNILNWLPFKADAASLQQSKTWATHNGQFYQNTDGAVLDATQFIPRTSRNEEFVKSTQKLSSLDNYERWFASRMAEGNRNNELFKFGAGLMDMGIPYPQVVQMVHGFNTKLGPIALTEEEIDSTVIKSLGQRYAKLEGVT